MASIVISGDTSGSVTLQAPAIAGSTVVTLPTTSMNIGTGGGSVATNTAFGASALAANTTGATNAAFGAEALPANTTGSDNTAVGRRSGQFNTTGSQNTMLGVQAMALNTTGGSNTAVGVSALQSNTTASNSTAVGYQAGYSTTTAGRNTLVGQIAGYALTTGGANVVVGDNAFKAATTAENSVAIGTYALAGTTTGNFNTAVGGGAGEAITTGSKNSILGRYNGNQGGLDIRTANNYIVLSDGDGNPRGYFDGSGSLFSTSGVICFTTSQYRSNVASSQLQFINNSAGVSLAVNGTSWGSLSDERDKEIVEPITNAVNKVSTLRSVIGRYKIDDADKRRAFLIAQDVQAVLPEAVTELDDEQKTLILQYTEVIPLLVAAIKEQQSLITTLTTRITALEAKVGA